MGKPRNANFIQKRGDNRQRGDAKPRDNHHRGAGRANDQGVRGANLAPTPGGGGGGGGGAFAMQPKEKGRFRAGFADVDAAFGYTALAEGETRLGYLLNVQPATVKDDESGAELSAIDFYFVCQDGTSFRATKVYSPYFYVGLFDESFDEVEGLLRRRFEGLIASVSRVCREDLDLKNHLSGLQATYLKLEFATVNDLMAVRRELAPIIAKNKKERKTVGVYTYDERSAPSALDDAGGLAGG
jgi:DNA polymerase epsilon subunit 1